MRTAEDVIRFWFEEHGQDDWFGGKPEFDAELAAQFAATHAAVARGEAFSWRATPEGRLAEIIVLDQFSRQLFRNSGQAFACDGMALVLAQEAVAQGVDGLLASRPRQMFLYLPYVHSESAAIQEEALRLFGTLGEPVVAYARGHHDVIRRFGRFPRRNDALGRISTPEEIDYMSDGIGAF